MFLLEGCGQTLAEALQILADSFHLTGPGGRVDVGQVTHVPFRNVQPGQIDGVRRGQMADRRFAGVTASLTAFDDPFDHAQILAETRPDEAALLVLTEPVDMENLRRGGEPFSHVEPVRPVVREVVAAERFHRHGIAPYHADRATLSRGGFRRDGGPDENAVPPGFGLVNQRDQMRPPAAENDGGDRDSARIFRFR